MEKNLKNHDLDLALKTAQKAAQTARKELLDRFQKLEVIHHKEKAGLVSEADVESERVIKQLLLEKFPGHLFLGEEEYFQSQRTSWPECDQPLWVVDPLDGTTNYVHGFPFFCISIGLVIDGRVEVALVDAPLLDTQYTAIRGHGAFKNGKPIHVSDRRYLGESMLATGFFTEYSIGLKEQLKIFNSLITHARAIRRAGASALEL